MDDFDWQAADDGPSPEEIERCASILQRISPSDLARPELDSVRQAGLPLFRRLVLKEKFGSEEVLDFLKQKSDVYQMTVKLERLHRVVKDEHDKRRQKAETCGMNLRRKADLAAIKAESARPDSLAIADSCTAEGQAAGPPKRDGEDVLDQDTTAEAGLVQEEVHRLLNVPTDSLYSNCNMCRGQYLEHHHFYHQLCPRCAEHNWQKRQQTADMRGMVCVVTGGRVRIGFQTVLKLLRAGAFVLTTSRFPCDCALRYSKEPDYHEWRERLEVCGPLELCDLRLVERFCQQLLRRFPRIHAGAPKRCTTAFVAFSEEGFRDPKVLSGALDLAVDPYLQIQLELFMACTAADGVLPAYLKNYAVDKADALYAATEPYCMERGLPWDVKWLQDCATLRCKQQRQPEAAVLLEEVAKRTPPHPATLNNLGTVYNMMRDHEKAQEYFLAAQQDDLWNMGIAKKHLGHYEEALPMLLKALEGWKTEEPDDDVTIAKLHDTVGSCFDLMGRHEEAVEQFASARLLFGRSIGADSPLYGSACEGLTKALLHAGRYAEAFDRLEETFLNHAQKDAIHPTPIFELLGLALEEFVDRGGVDPLELVRLEAPMEIAVKNMVYRGLDKDGNAGVVFERMAQVLLRCSMAQGDEARQRSAARRRELARSLLGRAVPLVEETTRSGEADLSHISALITMELQVLDAQDAVYRKALNGADPGLATPALNL
eukprot:s6812_g3.t1